MRSVQNEHTFEYFLLLESIIMPFGISVCYRIFNVHHKFFKGEPFAWVNRKNAQIK